MRCEYVRYEGFGRPEDRKARERGDEEIGICHIKMDGQQ